MVLRENGRVAGHAEQRAQRRSTVVERLHGTGPVQVHRKLVVEREQLRRVRVRPKEIVTERTYRGNLRQLFQTQDVAAVHLLLRGA